MDFNLAAPAEPRPPRHVLDLPVGSRIRILVNARLIVAGSPGSIVDHSSAPLCYVIVLDDDPEKERMWFDTDEVVPFGTDLKTCPGWDEEGCDTKIPVDSNLCPYCTSKDAAR
ncbi:hypothetical protein ACWCQN_38760 [Streptomyces sp. NPDC001984]